jgi:CNT family concentrative nucleoside transporter
MVGFSFAINVLPIIIFFAALMSVLYHLRIMEWLVRIVGGALHKIIGTGAIESMNAAANIFVGQTEAPLVVAGYVLMGAELKYLLAAAFMAAPGGLLMAKIIMPDDEYIPPGKHERLQMEPSHHRNVILAAAAGTTDGLRLAVNIGAMLIAFVALIALFNGLVGGVCGLLGIDALLGVETVTLEWILGKVWAEAEAAGSLFGEKIILNEFVAFSHLTERLAGMSPRTIAVTTFALCGWLRPCPT